MPGRVDNGKKTYQNCEVCGEKNAPFTTDGKRLCGACWGSTRYAVGLVLERRNRLIEGDKS